MNLEREYTLPTKQDLEERMYDYESETTVVDCHTIDLGNGLELYCDITIMANFDYYPSEIDYDIDESYQLSEVESVEISELTWYKDDIEIDAPENKDELIFKIEQEIKNFYR